MSRVVFILGAGTSKECGAPVIAEFLDAARNLLATDSTGYARDDFERVFKTIGDLQAVHSNAQLDLTNIESIFTALEIARVTRRLPGTEPDQINKVIASFKRLIVRTLEATLEFPVVNNRVDAPGIYLLFIDLLSFLKERYFPRQTVSVITFNYDLACDMALFRKGKTADYGMEDIIDSYNSIPLLKLHGSLNWASVIGSREIITVNIEEYLRIMEPDFTNDQKNYKLLIGSHLRKYLLRLKDVSAEYEPVIIPPSWNMFDRHKALSNVWSNAARHLSEAEYIFIIGYSLPETDAFFRLLYALGTVGKNALTRIIVYNPDTTGQVDKRFQQMLGPCAKDSYQYKPLKFSEAIPDIQSMFIS